MAQLKTSTLGEEKKMGQIKTVIGRSDTMRPIYTLIDKAARSECPVLITGESGTGKTLIAKMLHDRSFRSEGPFRTVNCGAIPADLVESELFGHVQYAFTSALKSRVGHFAKANGGTILLDEIGTMPLSTQPKILHVLDGESFVPVGGTNEVDVSVRIIAATNGNIEKLIRDGKFRQDLYYRLNTIRINLPPLRDRKEDIRTLSQHFLDLARAKHRRPKVQTINERAFEILEGYHWPGNIRELRSVIERAVVLSESIDGVINEADLPPHLQDPVEISELELPKPGRIGLKEAQEMAINTVQVRYITNALERSGGNISEMARILGIDRKHLRGLMMKHNLYDGNNGGINGEAYEG